MKYFIKKFLTGIGLPVTFISAFWLRFVAKNKMDNLSERICMYLGVLPVIDQYYQPLINPKKHLTKSLREDRKLPGIDFNTEGQLELLSKFNYNEELLKFPMDKLNGIEFYYNNGAYCSGDAEYLYNIIRYIKPKRIIEIGSGHSTLMARNAIKNNIIDDSNYTCKHICIEPYEQPWLEKVGIEVLRRKVEVIESSFFQQLEENDILFIDSSHIIRPQGDVLFEYLELLPILKSGVLIHIHDIFTPKDYLDQWIYERHLLWNEQYLLEAFLTNNTTYDVIGALNYLAHNYQKQFAEKCPVFSIQKNREPGAFWIIKK